MKLGELIKEYRWAKRINVRDLAKIIGCSAATLSRFERGRNPDGITTTKILKWILS